MKTPINRVLARESGSTLVELMIAIAILAVVTGAILSQLGTASQRISAEQVKVDNFDEARDFVDQFFRDINQIGYPNGRIVSNASVPPLISDSRGRWPGADQPHVAVVRGRYQRHRSRAERAVHDQRLGLVHAVSAAQRGCESERGQSADRTGRGRLGNGSQRPHDHHHFHLLRFQREPGYSHSRQRASECQYGRSKCRMDSKE